MKSSFFITWSLIELEIFCKTHGPKFDELWPRNFNLETPKLDPFFDPNVPIKDYHKSPMSVKASVIRMLRRQLRKNHEIKSDYMTLVGDIKGMIFLIQNGTRSRCTARYIG